MQSGGKEVLVTRGPQKAKNLPYLDFRSAVLLPRVGFEKINVTWLPPKGLWTQCLYEGLGGGERA